MSSVAGRRGAWRFVAVGLLGGALWGVVARLWMRYISTEPGFSWAGTLFIIGLATLAGVSLGTVEALRRRGTRGWRRLLALPALVMFAGAGIVLLPAAVLGGLAISGRGGRWVRWPVAVLAVASLLLLVLPGTDPIAHSMTLSIAWFGMLAAALAIGWSSVFLTAPSKIASQATSIESATARTPVR